MNKDFEVDYAKKETVEQEIINITLTRTKPTEQTKPNQSINQITFNIFIHWKATMEYHKTKDILYVMRLLGHKTSTLYSLYSADRVQRRRIHMQNRQNNPGSKRANRKRLRIHMRIQRCKAIQKTQVTIISTKA